jgi:aspartate kinase
VRGIGILGELTPRSLDLVATYGELMSSLLLTHHLHVRGTDAEWVNAQSFMITDHTFTKAVPQLPIVEQRLCEVIMPLVARKSVPVTQGFIGATSGGVPTTIGRGGSDYSAALIGALLGAAEIQIWTDVDGILTADPTLVEGARKIRVMSFAEASELAYFGARVLHPDTILPAIERNIPVRVLNSRRPDGTGTLIVARSQANANCIVKSVAYKENVTLISIVSSRMFLAHGFLEEVFDVFHKYRTVVHTVATSDVSVSATINDTSNLSAIAEDLSKFSTVAIANQKAIVCVVGDNLRNSPGVAGRILNAVADTNINMISQGASEINISFVVDEQGLSRVVRRLHEELFKDAGTLTEVFA